MRAYLLVGLLLLSLFGGIGGYLFYQFGQLSGTDFTPPPVTVAVSMAKTEEWGSLLNAIGTIRAVRGVELSTEERGEVIAINATSGAHVQQGDLILTLNDSVEQASRKSQIASLELAQLLYDRDAKLVAKKSIPQSQFDRSRADLERAVAQLAETEARLANMRIQAPFDGTIGILRVKVGDYVEPGDAIATLQNLDALEIDFTVPARYYPQLHQGLDIGVRVAAFPNESFHAVLQAIDSRADAATRNLALRASLDPHSALLPGMFAQLIVDLDQTQSVVTVPETAVTYSLQGDTVYVLKNTDQGLVAMPRVVRTGNTRSGRIAILEGLDPDTPVVSAGQNKLFRGAPVIVDKAVALRGL